MAVGLVRVLTSRSTARGLDPGWKKVPWGGVLRFLAWGWWDIVISSVFFFSRLLFSSNPARFFFPAVAFWHTALLHLGVLDLRIIKTPGGGR